MVQLAPGKWQASRAHIHSLLIHNQSVVHLEGQTCPLPSIAAFSNGLSAHTIPGSRLLEGAISVEAGSSLPLSVYFVRQHSTRRGLSF